MHRTVLDCVSVFRLGVWGPSPWLQECIPTEPTRAERFTFGIGPTLSFNLTIPRRLL